MMPIIDVKFDEFTHDYVNRSNGNYTLYELADGARRRQWAGFALVDDGSFEPLTDWRDGYRFSCECWEHRTRVNSEITRKAFENAGVDVDEWNGYIVWDASNPAGYAVAREISASLHDYPCLDDEMLSQIEWDYACELVDNQYGFFLPDGVTAEDVIRVMPETPVCGNCSSYDVDEALEELGYIPCATCREYIKATGERVCHECALYNHEGECGCITDYVTSLKARDVYPLLSDLKEVRRGCATCYPLMWPNTEYVDA